MVEIDEIFGFMVLENGDVMLSLVLNGKREVIAMHPRVAEAIGFKFITASKQGTDLIAGIRAFMPNGHMSVPPRIPPMPEDPVPPRPRLHLPWGPPLSLKPTNKPN